MTSNESQVGSIGNSLQTVRSIGIDLKGTIYQVNGENIEWQFNYAGTATQDFNNLQQLLFRRDH